MKSIVATFVLLAIVLGVVGWASPEPDRVTDRGVYEATMARLIVPDCSDLHCFRVLVPWLLAPVPLPSIVKWKAYAAICNAAAAIAAFAFCVACGLPQRTAWTAAIISAAGFGGLYTLHDPYTSDPLMYALAPALTTLLMQARFGLVAAIASVSVLAKEFAAAPAYLFAVSAVLAHRWREALLSLVAANTAFIVWTAFTLTMMIAFNYSYGGTDSAKLTSGAGIVPWLHRLSLRGAASAMFDEFGPLYILAPVGVWLAPVNLRRLGLAAVPIAAVLAYVQQPDRALWNFHFLVTAFSALALNAAGFAITLFVLATFALGNLKVGAQLTVVPAARFGLGVSAAVAAVAAVRVLTRGRSLLFAPAEVS